MGIGMFLLNLFMEVATAKSMERFFWKTMCLEGETSLEKTHPLVAQKKTL